MMAIEPGLTGEQKGLAEQNSHSVCRQSLSVLFPVVRSCCAVHIHTLPYTTVRHTHFCVVVPVGIWTVLSGRR